MPFHNSNPLDDAERQLVWSREYLKREKAKRRIRIIMIACAVLFLVSGFAVAAVSAVRDAAQNSTDSSFSSTLEANASVTPASDPSVSEPADPNPPISAPSEPEPTVSQPTEHGEFSVTFNTRGGSGDYPQETALFGTLLTLPEPPERTGYRFDGWYKDAQCTEEWDFALDSVQSDLTLYAKWTDTSPADSTLPQTGIESHSVFWVCVFAAALVLAFAAAALLLRSYRRNP